MSTIENAYALIIGIANYQHINKLPSTVLKDAQDIYELLVDPNVCGYPPENVQLLLDTKATQATIRQTLTTLAKGSDEEATIFLYISSHGGRIKSGPDAGAYLLPVDVEVDTSVSPPQIVAETAISGAEFTAALESISGRKVVVVLDCCYSGGVGQPKDGLGATFKVGLPESYYDILKAGRGRVVLASSRSSEYSYVMPGAKNSLFTEHLLAGLRGGIPSEDGLIRIFNLFEYIQPRVTGDQPHQHPIFKAEVEENYPIALYRGGQKGVVSGAEEEFRYDVYISYVDQEPDATWVWDTLAPRLKETNLRVAVSGDVEDPGVARVVNIERGIRQAKRTMVVLSETYLSDHMANFENVLAQTMGIQEGKYRLLPVKIESLDDDRLPTRLAMLTSLNLVHPRRAEREFDRLIQALQGPVPHS